MGDVDQSISAIHIKYVNDDLNNLRKVNNGVLPKIKLGDLGYIHGWDKFEPGLSLYHQTGINILKVLNDFGIELVVDDISNLTRKVDLFDIAIRLNHSIFYMRNPTGYQAIPIAEFISGCWKASQFEINFVRFWRAAQRQYPRLVLKSVGSDWYTGFQSKLNLILNGWTSREYCVYGIIEASGLVVDCSKPNTRIWSCFGHASNNISKKFSTNNNTKKFALAFWRALYRSITWIEYCELFTFLYYACNCELCGYYTHPDDGATMSMMNVLQVYQEYFEGKTCTDDLECDEKDDSDSIHKAYKYTDGDNAYLFDRSTRIPVKRFSEGDGPIMLYPRNKVASSCVSQH